MGHWSVVMCYESWVSGSFIGHEWWVVGRGSRVMCHCVMGYESCISGSWVNWLPNSGQGSWCPYRKYLLPVVRRSLDRRWNKTLVGLLR